MLIHLRQHEFVEKTKDLGIDVSVKIDVVTMRSSSVQTDWGMAWNISESRETALSNTSTDNDDCVTQEFRSKFQSITAKFFFTGGKATPSHYSGPARHGRLSMTTTAWSERYCQAVGDGPQTKDPPVREETISKVTQVLWWLKCSSMGRLHKGLDGDHRPSWSGAKSSSPALSG